MSHGGAEKSASSRTAGMPRHALRFDPNASAFFAPSPRVRAQATTPASAWRRRVKVASTSRSSAERVVVRMRSPSRNLRRRGNRSRAGISHRTS